MQPEQGKTGIDCRRLSLRPPRCPGASLESELWPFKLPRPVTWLGREHLVLCSHHAPRCTSRQGPGREERGCGGWILNVPIGKAYATRTPFRAPRQLERTQFLDLVAQSRAGEPVISGQENILRFNVNALAEVDARGRHVS
jgi:hypothetical protein